MASYLPYGITHAHHILAWLKNAKINNDFTSGASLFAFWLVLLHGWTLMVLNSNLRFKKLYMYAVYN